MLENENFIRLNVNSISTLALVDSGAARSCISQKFVNRLRIKVQPLQSGHPLCLSTADCSPLTLIGTVSLTLNIHGLLIPQTFAVLKRLNYNMLLGLDWLQNTQATVDFNSRTVSICDDLVVQPLISHKLPTNVIRPTSPVQLLPQSEALLPVRVTGHCNNFRGQYLVEPLPSLPHLGISLARAVVTISQNKCTCRILNPTNSTISLSTRTPLASITPIPLNAISQYKKSPTPVTPPSVDLEHQKTTVEDLGIEIDASDYNDEQRSQLITLLYTNRDLFTSDIRHLPGTDLVTHHIDTADAVPVRQRPFRNSPEARKEIDRQIDTMLEAGIVEESESPWGSPVVLVRKRNNTHRLCVDLRRLNALTRPKHFPLPLLEDVIQSVAESQPSTYSLMDLTSGFWQIKLDEESKPKTAFVTHRGHYHFTRLPFGAVNATASYQGLMAKVLKNILFSYALCYVDDLIAWSPSPERHCEHLAEIFDRFRQAKLRLNPSKCKFALAKVVYLGHVFHKDGISVDESKVSVIKTYPIPQNVQQLRSFLGLANYYRRFLKNFSIKTANLRSLLKRDAKFVWNAVHQAEFDFLKDALVSAPILAFPNMHKEFILTTDACTSGIAFILSQLDNQGREHVIAYGGRGLRSSEVKWTISELECLAIIEGTRAYHTYLASRPFTIVTDHVSLTYLKSLKAGRGRLQRWALHLQGYTFTVHYKAGKTLTSADGLSRRDYPTPPPESDNEALDDDAYLSCIDANIFESTTNDKQLSPKTRERHFINFVYETSDELDHNLQ